MCNPIPIVRSGWILRHALRTFSVYHYYKCNQTAEKKPIIRIKIDKIKELLEFKVEQDEPKT